MLESVAIRNFKRFKEVEVELGEIVLLIGPNNSGKTSALQALALWELGLRRWHEKRGGKQARKRTGVAINRRDLVSIPVPDASHFWRDLRLRTVENVEGQRKTSNIRIDITVRGVTQGESWECGLEFDFANSESLYCRPSEPSQGDNRRLTIPPAALATRVAYLPPMSGLTASETRLDPGAVQVRLGEGRTAEVLRNLCLQIAASENADWSSLVEATRSLFGVELRTPEYIPERGEVAMTYRDRRGVELDLTAAGRGLQQTLLLLAYLHLHPGSVILLDEPDAHLEILRQRQIYQTLTELARAKGCQVIAASHSEVLLNEAADRDVVVAFVGRPHRIDDRGTQVAKSLKAIGYESYALAEQTGWVLYLEGSTDLAILRAFAETLDHPARQLLERPFVHYVENQVSKAADHFFGLQEAKRDLAGLVILDRQPKPLKDHGVLKIFMWTLREIENYLLFPEVLKRYAKSLTERRHSPLFDQDEESQVIDLMESCIKDQMPPAAYRDPEHTWWRDVKASGEFLDAVFADFFKLRNLPNLMRKTDYHVLARWVPSQEIHQDIVHALDLVVEVAENARPVDS